MVYECFIISFEYIPFFFISSIYLRYWCRLTCMSIKRLTPFLMHDDSYLRIFLFRGECSSIPPQRCPLRIIYYSSRHSSVAFFLSSFRPCFCWLNLNQPTKHGPENSPIEVRAFVIASVPIPISLFRHFPISLTEGEYRSRKPRQFKLVAPHLRNRRSRSCS